MITSPAEVSLQWPLFGPRPGKMKKFWEKAKNLWQPGATILMEGHLDRISNKKTKAKTYYYRLTSDYTLFYFKKEDAKQPKGKVQLNEYMLMNMKQIDIPKSSKVVALQLIKADNLCYRLFDQQGPVIFDWWNILLRKCTLNNFDDLYLPMEILGKGSFATVYKVRRLFDSKIMAAKFYYRDVFLTNPHKDRFVNMIRNETSILRAVNHHGIVKVHEMFQMPDKVVLIMDFIQGHDLYQLIKINKRITEERSAVITANISDSLYSLTEAGFVHRDLKLENVLLENSQTLKTKLVDFGFAEQINHRELTSKAGTPGYIAPEVFYNLPYEEKGDVFSLGIILFSLVAGYSPFKGRTYRKIMMENKEAEIKFDQPVWKEISSECQELIQRMTKVNVQERISFKEILTHPWILQHQEKCFNRKQSELKFDFSQQEINSFAIHGSAPRSFYRQSIKSLKSPRTVSPGGDIKSPYSHRQFDTKQFNSGNPVQQPITLVTTYPKLDNDTDSLKIDIDDDQPISWENLLVLQRSINKRIQTFDFNQSTNL